MRTKIFFVRSSQAFWQSAAPGPMSTLMTSVVLYSFTRATLMSSGKDETRVCVYNIYIYIYIHMYMKTKMLAHINELLYNEM